MNNHINSSCFVSEALVMIRYNNPFGGFFDQ